MVGREPEQLRLERVEVKGERLKQTEVCTYLGSAITADGRLVRDVERRIAGVARAFVIIKRRL